MTTIASILREAHRVLAAGSDTARLDAEVLLAHALGRDRTYLRAWPERLLDREQQQRFRQLTKRRSEGMPVAYLTGVQEFWSREFAVSPDVLIPRPETELLVELALRAASCQLAPRILDLGTGSGAIAVTLAAELPGALVFATDRSEDALALARHNAERHGAGQVRFFVGDWFDALPAKLAFDLIVSNPPYIAAADPHLGQGDVRYEPRLALCSGADGLDAIRCIAANARSRLSPSGSLLLEHGYDQAERVAELLAGIGYGRVSHHRDLQGHRRVTSGAWRTR